MTIKSTKPSAADKIFASGYTNSLSQDNMTEHSNTLGEGEGKKLRDYQFESQELPNQLRWHR
jgi:hypothetical protein